MSSWLKSPCVCIFGSASVALLSVYLLWPFFPKKKGDDAFIEEFKPVSTTLDRALCKPGCTCGCVGCRCAFGKPCKGGGCDATNLPKCAGCPSSQTDDIVCECTLGSPGPSLASTEVDESKCRNCKPGCTCDVSSCTCASDGPCPPCCETKACCVSAVATTTTTTTTTIAETTDETRETNENILDI